jgi:hypothetical protein
MEIINMTKIKQLTNIKKAAQKGFTLIELAIVGLFLGLLAIFAITQFSGSATDTTKANSLYEASTKIVDNWALVSMQCGTTTDITASPLGNATPTAAANMSMLLGTSAVNATYAGCYSTSGIKALSGIATGAAGSEKVQGFTTTLAKGATDRQVKVAYALVPDNVVLPLYNKYSSASGASTATAVPATADTTDPQIQFGALSGGTRTMTIIKSF